MIILVNSDNLFNENMIKNFEMVEYQNYLEETLYIERETFNHFEMLKSHLKVDGITIDIQNAYRSLETQECIFLKYMKKYGIEETEKMVCMPGVTEHHTGQAIDFVLNKNNKWLEKDELLKEKATLNKIYSSLKYFGFILRYPKDKENITSHFYEPEHIRYIGEKESIEIGDKTLEEYLNF